MMLGNQIAIWENKSNTGKQKILTRFLLFLITFSQIINGFFNAKIEATESLFLRLSLVVILLLTSITYI